MDALQIIVPMSEDDVDNFWSLGYWTADRRSWSFFSTQNDHVKHNSFSLTPFLSSSLVAWNVILKLVQIQCDKM